jgi:hypothetical protein
MLRSRAAWLILILGLTVGSVSCAAAGRGAPAPSPEDGAPRPVAPPPVVAPSAPMPATPPPVSVPIPDEPPAPDRADASVAFRFPRVAAQPPDLTVVIHNDGARALPMVTFASAACFARHWLAITVTGRDGRPLALGPCPVRSFPGTATTIAPGADLTVVLPLREVFPTIGPGDFDVDLRWDPTALRAALGPDAGFDVLSSSVSDTRLTIAKPRRQFEIRRGQSVTLPGGATLRFGGHSHKMVDADSAPGPLIVVGAFGPAGTRAEEFSVSLFPDAGPAIFELGPDGSPHVFELIDFAYDESMRLRYFGVLR